MIILIFFGGKGKEKGTFPVNFYAVKSIDEKRGLKWLKILLDNNK